MFGVISRGGYLSRSGGYWIVPDRGFRISLATGYFWKLKDSSRQPLGDLLTLWMIVKHNVSVPTYNLFIPSAELFHLSVESLLEWVEQFPVRADLPELSTYDS